MFNVTCSIIVDDATVVHWRDSKGVCAICSFPHITDQIVMTNRRVRLPTGKFLSKDFPCPYAIRVYNYKMGG